MSSRSVFHRFCLGALAAALGNLPLLAGDPVDEPLLTVAEKSDFRATARHAEVVALLDRLAALAPIARRTSLGKTVEGREIPALIIADPPVATPEEAKRRCEQDGKIVVLAIGNIHAGEVDGKEALPIIAREILLSEDRPLLKNLILVFAPIYNADGNERVDKGNRPGQVGPEEGMGQRHNAQNLDLNRDFVKLEAPESRALIDFMNCWDPAIFIDTHTTNGSYHRYIVTYEGPKVPAGDAPLIEYCRNRMMPEISHKLDSHGVATFVYGDFNAEHTRWETYPAFARYGTSYVGMRNRISILSEGYSYATYRERVEGTREFVNECLAYAAAHAGEIRSLLRDIDARAIREGRAPDNAPPIALRTEAAAAPGKATAAGFVEEGTNGRTRSTGVAKDYEVELWTHFRATLTVKRPYAYVIPPARTRAIELLKLHGIEHFALAEETQAEVEAYRIDTVERSPREFQGHRLAKLEATPTRGTRTLAAGSIIVPSDQRLGRFAAYLLEPECEDGMVTWGLFDDDLKEGAEFPVLRVVTQTVLPERP